MRNMISKLKLDEVCVVHTNARLLINDFILTFTLNFNIVCALDNGYE